MKYSTIIKKANYIIIPHKGLDRVSCLFWYNYIIYIYIILYIIYIVLVYLLDYASDLYLKNHFVAQLNYTDFAIFSSHEFHLVV